MSRETKTLSFQIKATGVTTTDDGQQLGHIEAYGAAFNVVDEGNDRILPGAFNRTIQNSKARAKARGKKYALKMLWQHDTNEVIGGWYDISEDATGLRAKGDILLATKRGQEYYELAKAEMMDEFSIIYDIPQGGSKYTKDGVRELSEMRLFSIDPVTFPMCNDPHTISVKHLQYKKVCGQTNFPLSGANEKWDGDKADKQIVGWITKSDDTYDFGKLQQICLYYDESVMSDKDATEAQKLSCHKLPYCYIVNGKPEICIQRVYDCAGAVDGAHGGLKGVSDADIAKIKDKLSTLYKRIAKDQNDDTIKAPWDKEKSMDRQRLQRKTLLEHYCEENAKDLLRDLQDVYICSLIKSIFDAFTIGDQPAQDISEALDAFKELMLSKFVAQAVECDLSQYLEDNGYQYTPGLSTMLNGSDNDDYGYSYMSRATDMQRKEGRTVSAANQAIIDEHTKCLHGLAKKARSDMQAHTNDMHAAIDGMAGNNSQDDNDDEKSRHTFSFKAGRAISAPNADKLHDMADKAMSIVADHAKALKAAAQDLTNTLYAGGDKPGYEDGEEDEEKGLALAFASIKALRAV